MTNPHIETLVNFLRDFADANADSFDPEQIEYLKQSAHAIVILDHAVDELVKERDEAFKQIDDLVSERDNARREVCEQEAYLWDEPATRSAQHIAESRGWNCFMEDSDAEESH
jgi:hypothetical protein